MLRTGIPRPASTPWAAYAPVPILPVLPPSHLTDHRRSRTYLAKPHWGRLLRRRACQSHPWRTPWRCWTSCGSDGCAGGWPAIAIAMCQWIMSIIYIGGKNGRAGEWWKSVSKPCLWESISGRKKCMIGLQTCSTQEGANARKNATCLCAAILDPSYNQHTHTSTLETTRRTVTTVAEVGT